MIFRHLHGKAAATSAALPDLRPSTFDFRPFRAGFTLMEMLSVIVLVSILMTAAGMSVRKATQLAKNTKAEAECRELVNALLEYRATFNGKWPEGASSGGAKDVSASFLKPLVDASGNDRGIVFLNLSITSGTWNDPWGNPYKVYFPGEEKPRRPAAVETCVSFPFRNTAPILK